MSPLEVPVLSGDEDQDPEDYRLMRGTFDASKGGIHGHTGKDGKTYRHQHDGWNQQHKHPRDASGADPAS